MLVQKLIVATVIGIIAVQCAVIPASQSESQSEEVSHRLEPRKNKGVSLLCIMLGPLCPIWIAAHYIHHAGDDCRECERLKHSHPAPPPPTYDPYDPNNNPALPATEIQPDGTTKVELPNLVPDNNEQPGQVPGVLPESEIGPDGTNKIVGPGVIPTVDSAPAPLVMGPDGTMQPLGSANSPLPEDELMPDGTTKLAPPGTGPLDTVQVQDSITRREVSIAETLQARDQELRFEPLQDAESSQLRRRDLIESSSPIQYLRRLVSQKEGSLWLQD